MKAQMLLVAMSVAIAMPSAMAAPVEREKVIHLGAVNGAINGNQVVEVVRTLPDPVLFEANRSDTDDMPSYLVVRQAIANDGAGGDVLLRQSRHVITPAGQPAQLALAYSARLWVDGQAANATWQQRGEDVVIGLPQGAQTISLRSDSPVTLQLPKGYRGEVSLVLEVEGWRTDP
ncbi:DUF5462 family protein [Aeromonas sp. Y318-1]|uniref:DUF5462 family protein n=1 Tax=Aeromonas TaxID=642 RepID=UPI0022E6DEA3|nr:DUF5462 family protein [Aeromonas sp. Y318-1]